MPEESMEELRKKLAAANLKNAALEEETGRIHKEKMDKTFKLHEITKRLEKTISERNGHAMTLKNLL